MQYLGTCFWVHQMIMTLGFIARIVLSDECNEMNSKKGFPQKNVM